MLYHVYQFLSLSLCLFVCMSVLKVFVNKDIAASVDSYYQYHNRIYPFGLYNVVKTFTFEYTFCVCIECDLLKFFLYY